MEPVFYLENDENDFLLMQVAFRKVGCREFVRWFRRSSDLKAALNKCAFDQLPRVLLTDLKLDGEYGLEVIEWFAKQDRLRGIASFIISSGQIGHEIVATLEKNATGYIFKPSSLEGWMELARQFKAIALPENSCAAANASVLSLQSASPPNF
jgi:CheY-like chemotaxis protein